MDTCKHGTPTDCCSLCRPRKKDPVEIRKPLHRSNTRVQGAESSTTSQAFSAGYIVIPSRGRRKVTKIELNYTVTFVHIDGFPYLWLIRQLLEAMTNLQVIQVTPKMMRRIGQTHHQACAEKSVRLISGYHYPAMAWEGTRSPYFRQQRSFLQNLEGEQKQLFQELLQLDFPAARLVARYFCLGNEEVVSQHDAAKEVDFPPLGEVVISDYINSVLHYLDPSFASSPRSIQMAGAMAKRVNRLREILKEATTRAAIAQRLGITQLPDKFPFSRLLIFEEVLKVSRSERFQSFQKEHPREYRVLCLRYGMEDNFCHSLGEIAHSMGNLSRERIRQLEVLALQRLGILEE